MSARPPIAAPSARDPEGLGAAFARDGLVRVPDSVPAGELAAMRDELRRCIATLEVVEIAGARRPARGTELTMWAVGRAPAFARLADERAAPITYDDAPGALAAAEPWFAALLRDPSTAAASCDSDGVALHLVELTGEPGELVLLHPRCLHTISANVSSRARLVMRLTCLRTAVARE